MNDRELENLVRMAIEADELAGSQRAHRRTWWALPAGLTAAAACLVAAFAMWPHAQPIATKHLVPTPPDVAPEPVEDSNSRLAAATPAAESIVFALFRGPDGDCQCVQWHDPKLDAGRTLADLSRTELVGMVLEDPCTTSAQHMLLVGVTGGAESVATVKADAEGLAMFLGDSPLPQGDLSGLAYEVLPELPVGSTVIAEKVAFRPQ